ncbi:MAG TPA: hypothetical protein PK638_05135 [Candidatus Enterocola sp.]|nr:hypothetical protein [Candidatus Enterocola sp.]
MHPILKNSLAILAGAFIGGALNMAIIMVSSHIIPPPDGADLKTIEGLKAAMHLMEPKHFLMPFLAHALGTLVGSCITAYIVPNQKIMYALLIATWFMLGGIMNIFMLPSPTWFTITDLIGAYLPMGFLGGYIATRLTKEEC